MGRLFGTNGVRGVFNKDLTLDLALRLSYAIGEYFKVRNGSRIVLGYDGRYSSPLLADVVSAGLNAMGIDIYNTSLVPTPCLQYYVKRLNYDGGIMITASHNPPEYNGIKVIASDGVEIPREDEVIIEDIFFSEMYKLSDRLGNEYSINDAIDTYIDGITALVDIDAIRSKGFKVVVDLGNGAQAVAVPKLLKELGCKVTMINERIDGSFPGRGSEPTVDNLNELVDKVRDVGADLGVAYDGDGDRSIFCDSTGAIYTGDRSGTILIEHILKNKIGNIKVVTPVNSSILIDMIAGKYNSPVYRVKVGSVEVSRAMLNIGALIGLEENGGFMYARHIAVRDGAMTTALMLEALARSNKTLYELSSMYKRFYQYKTRFYSKGNSSIVIEELSKDAMSKGKRVDMIDGVKVWIDDDTWIMVRASGTEPIMRLYAESADENKLRDVVRLYNEKVNAILDRYTRM